MEEPLNLNIPNIEKELAKLWKTAEEEKRVKACLFTLVIYSSEPKRVKYLQELSDTILSKFPCRLIFIQADLGSAKRYFEVEVSSVMSGNIESKSTIACDQILIRTSKDQLFRVPYVVIPRLQADLPIFLLWGQNPFEENDVFPKLQPYASRVIFDSEWSQNLNLFCKEMLLGIEALGIDSMDINWALISNWRDMLLQLFSGKEMIDELFKCKSLTITYNDTEAANQLGSKDIQYPEIRAIYLQGWLSACLKWHKQSLEIDQVNTIIKYVGNVGNISVTLAPKTNTNLPIGAILSLEFIMNDDSTYEITRKEKLSQVIVHTSTKNECLLPYTLPLPNAHRGMNFMQEIFYNSAGAHYHNMIDSISKLDFDLIKRDR